LKRNQVEKPDVSELATAIDRTSECGVSLSELSRCNSLDQSVKKKPRPRFSNLEKSTLPKSEEY